MSCQVELVPITEGNSIVVQENEKVIIGRGSSLGCNEKKISRHHAELVLKSDQTLWIKPTHINPVFYRPANGKTISLTKDIEQELKDDDQIGLLPTSFFFRISFCKDVKSRKLPTWMSTSSNDRPSVKRQLSDEEQQSNDEVKKSSTTDEEKPSAPKTFDSEDSFDATPAKKVKKSDDKPRPPCPYGATCYRKNPAHRTEQSHPGDSDYEDEKQTSKNENDDDKPSCPYGKTCYRQNPQHKREYKH